MPAQQVSISSGKNAGEKSTGKTKRNMPQGRKQAFAPESIAKIKRHLVEQSDQRGLALLLASLDTSLRSIDLLHLRVSDVCDHNMQVVHRFGITQRKTQKTVECSLAPATREAIAALISAQGKVAGDYLWTAKSDVHGDHITRVMFRRIVKAWATAADLDPRRFSGHSTRRTRPTLVYRQTKDVHVCAQLLGHQNLGHTIAYIGADSKAALDLADTITF